MSEEKTVVRVLDWKLFPERRSGGPAGMAFFEIEDQITLNYGSDFFWPFQQNEDGSPNISVSSATRSLNYELASEVSVAINKLKEAGWLAETTHVTHKSGGDGGLVVQVSKWRDDNGQEDRNDLYEFLSDIEEELLLSNKAFSEDWYFARIAKMYFCETWVSPSSAFNIGILVAQMWWKFQHEESAILGEKNASSLSAAEAAKKLAASERRIEKMECVSRLWHEAKQKFGGAEIRKDTNAAYAIKALAEEQLPDALKIKTSGKIVGADAIRRLLPELRSQGKID